MSRKSRLFVPGGLYHVMLRGNGGQNIFNDDQGRHHIYKLFQDGVNRFEHRIIAFCLMDNHIYLAIQVGTIQLYQMELKGIFKEMERISTQRRFS